MKQFQYPECEIVVLSANDIIVTSGCAPLVTQSDDCIGGTEA